MIKKIHLKITQKEKIKPFLICLLITIVFWMVQTLSDTYEYEKVYPIEFSGYDAQKFSFISSDTAMLVLVRSTGFQYISGLFSQNGKMKFVVTDVNYYENKGNRVYAISLKDNRDKIKEQIVFLRQKEIQFSIDTVRLVLAKRVMKKVKLEVKDVTFEFSPQYGLYGNPTITPDSIEIYGSEKSLENITVISTQKQKIKNINKTGIYKLRLKSLVEKYPDVQFSAEYIDINLPIEKYTEMTLAIPLKFQTEDTSVRARLYPEKVEVVLDVALKDYKGIVKEMFDVEVIYNGDATKNMLPVSLSKFPCNVRIKQIKPEQVQYVIIK